MTANAIFTHAHTHVPSFIILIDSCSEPGKKVFQMYWLSFMWWNDSVFYALIKFDLVISKLRGEQHREGQPQHSASSQPKPLTGMETFKL